MKKKLIMVLVVILICTPVLIGAYALYNSNVKNTPSNNVSAKEFKVLSNVTKNFGENIKIAPEETVETEFTVANFDGTKISETAIELNFSVKLLAAESKSAITPLKLTFKKGEEIIGSVSGVGDITYKDKFEISPDGQKYTYTVILTWESTENDIDFAGSEFGSQFQVNLSATQIAAGK